MQSTAQKPVEENEMCVIQEMVANAVWQQIPQIVEFGLISVFIVMNELFCLLFKEKSIEVHKD